VNTTDDWKKWAKERGSSADEPGLIVSKRLGGSGIDSVNLFPKSPSLDKSSWAEDEEKAYNEASEMKKWKKIKFYVRLEYPDADSLRPSSIEYQYELPSGTVLHSKVKNEPASAPSEETKEAEEDEDEYEYEYEEEEEEEAPEVLEKAVSEEPPVVAPTVSKQVEESISVKSEPEKSPSPEVQSQPVYSYEPSPPPQKSPSPEAPTYTFRPPPPQTGT
jgi:hypothetical protein